MKKHLFIIFLITPIFFQILEAQNSNEDSQDLLSIYEDLQEFSEGFAAAKKEGKWGYVNTKGEPITPFIYDADPIYSTVFPFQNGFARVRQGEFLGLINTAGKQITPCKYHLIDDFSEGLAGVAAWDDSKEELELKKGYIDTNGKEVIPLIYNGGGDFIGGKAYVFIGEKNGYINTKGEVIAGLVYDLVSDYSDGYALVKQNEKYGYIDKEGKLQIECIYDDAGHFSEGLVMVRKGKHYGFINKKGQAITPFTYSYRSLFHPLEQFENGLVVVFKNGFCSCMDNTGEVLMPIYLEQCIIEGNLIKGIKKGKLIYFDRNGYRLTPFIYDADGDDGYFQEGLRKVFKQDKWGYIDTTGAEVIPMIYDALTDFKNGKATAQIGEKEISLQHPLHTKPSITWHNNYETAFFDSTYQLVLEVNPKKRMNEKLFLQSLQININGEQPPMQDLSLEYKKEEGFYELRAKFGVPTTWGDYHLTVEMEVEKEPLYIARYFHNMHPDLRQFLRPGMDSVAVILDVHYDEVEVSDTNIRAFEGDSCVYEKALKYPFPTFKHRLSGKFVKIEVAEKVGYMNLEGDTIVPPICDPYQYYYAYDDCICLSKDQQYGCIDTLGNTVIPFIYDNMGEFVHGIAMVEKWGKRGFIDRKGTPIIEMSFDHAYHYGNGIIMIRHNHKEGLLYYKKINRNNVSTH